MMSWTANKSLTKMVYQLLGRYSVIKGFSVVNLPYHAYRQYSAKNMYTAVIAKQVYTTIVKYCSLFAVMS